MKNAFVRTSMIVALTVTTAGLASAQEVVTMPGNASSLTTLTAVVSDQARITVPSTVTFNVTNIAAATVASGVSFLADNIVLSSASATLNVSLIGNAATFTAPLASPTWAVADVSWGAGRVHRWHVRQPARSPRPPVAVATCAAAVATCGTTGSTLVFTLAPKTTVTRSGNHTLTMTWKFASIG